MAPLLANTVIITDGVPFNEPTDPNQSAARQRTKSSLVGIDDLGNITLPALATVDGRDVSVDGAKLDLITVTGAIDLGQVVVGPASAGDEEIARFSGATGKLIQGTTNSTLNDQGHLILAGTQAAIDMVELAAGPNAQPGRGHYWTKNDVPTRPKFTNDVGAEYFLDLQGNVVGPASAVTGNLATFNGITGELIADSGQSVAGVLARANHTGTQLASTISDFEAAVEDDIVVGNSISTGLISLDNFSINVDTTKFDIGAAVGYVVDSTTDPENPVLTKVVFPAQAAIIDLHLATANITYVGINSAGAVVQQGTPFTDAQRRSIMVVGRSGHPDRATITSTVDFPNLGISPSAQLHDLIEALGLFNRSGNSFFTGSANLAMHKTAGETFALGSNYENDPKQPHTRITPAGLPLASFLYVLQDGTNSTKTLVDPSNYDVASAVTPVPPIKWTNQRIYMFGGGQTNILYGQNLYNSLSEAVAAHGTESFIEPEIFKQAAMPVAIMSIKVGTTDLQNTSNVFLHNLERFGGGGGISGTTDLQGAYDNSGVPSILTDAIRNAVGIQQGSGSDADTILEILNGVGAVAASIDGIGNIVLDGLLDGRDVAADGTLLDSFDADLPTFSLPANTTISTFGASLVDDADAATARATLGVDPAGTDNSTNVSLAVGLDYLTIAGQILTLGQVNLATDITGLLPTANLADEAVTNAKLAHVATQTIKGRATAATGDVEDLTATQVRTLINVEDGADVTDAANVAAAGGLMTDVSNDADGVQMLERADHPNVPAATKGQFWVKNDAPNKPYFTDDAGADFDLTAGTGGGSGPSQLAISVDAGAMAPRATNGAAVGVVGGYPTNDVVPDFFLFDGAIEEGVQFKTHLPKDYNGGVVNVIFHWDGSTGATAADGVTWGVSLRTVENDDAIDQAFPASVDTDDVLIAVGDMHVSPNSANVTISGTPNAGDMIMGEITRVVGDVGDTMTEDAKLMSVEIVYEALAATDQYKQSTIPAGAFGPHTTNGAAAGTTIYTNNEFDHFAFDAATEESIYLQFELPQDYKDGSVLRWGVSWDAVATASGTAVFGLSGGAFGDAEALSTALGTERTLTDTVGTVGQRRRSPNDATGITLAGSPVAGDLVTLKLVVKISGTIAVDVLFLSLELQFEKAGVAVTAFA